MINDKNIQSVDEHSWTGIKVKTDLVNEVLAFLSIYFFASIALFRVKNIRYAKNAKPSKKRF